MPKVSVLMPNYNWWAYLGGAIESIISQSFTDFEFIIIDDGSTDDSWDIISSYAEKDTRIVAVKNDENLRICKTLNKWLLLSKWEFIARMDSDDISLPNRLEEQANFLTNNSDVGIVWWNIEMFNEKGPIWKREYHVDDTSIRKHIFRYSPFCHPAVMIRKSILDVSWWYNNDLVFAEDYDFYFRIWKHSHFANIDKVLLQYRMLETNSTSRKLQDMESKTLYIRLKAVMEYWYKMTIFDKIYFSLQYMSSFILRWKLRIYVFNFIRNIK